ncbi:benzoyl-CoA 2,3-epoxidase subunit BoxA [Chitinasiproducens palmae]|uniref:Benzoyl-CoA oxygenase component A n=1 Tax=Chitinasiproducens palmae TaxID=1770053 RepID=A0A1H2PS11_9BURK|nr:benzoyl-CoA 2,3-epoxidase subunit BoxA [Chitinasiproducens palmae]SDV49734.1 benzoyl-CoA oxygenase, component A [Chitinasiproducens palmae]
MNGPMPSMIAGGVLNQHLIDPEVCIRCNTCEETCPIDAITHDDTNYVVRAETCNGCMACVPPCPTGAIDNWRMVAREDAYSLEDQYGWDVLPAQGTVATSADAPGAEQQEPGGAREEAGDGLTVDTARGSQLPPWSAARPYVNLYTHKLPTTATVVGNYRLTAEDADSAIHHIVLDFGKLPFPVLEGQSIGILPPGGTADGRAHHARQYSIASPRDGERPGYNNLSLTVKRVRAARNDGRDGRDGVCSNYLCDLQKGDSVQVIGPFGHTFLMPNHPASDLLMICTGTGAAPMRAMTEYRRRKRLSGATGRLMLFFGARSADELPYFGPLTRLPKDFIDTNLAFSRSPDEPRRYVQDLMRARAPDVAALLRGEDSYIYVCGLKAMEEGVLQALAAIAEQEGLDWPVLWERLRREGRLHIETY